MSWHLDKNLTIGVIIVVVINSASLIWGAAELAGKIDMLSNVPSRMTKVEERILVLETEARMIKGAFGEFKQVMTDFKETMTRIDREQARRTPMVKHIEFKMNKSHK